MESAQIDKAQALDFLGLHIMKYGGFTHVLTQSFAEITVADANNAIAENIESISITEQSPIAGADIWHVKVISAWTVVKNILETEGSQA